jgi:hypothetical protein
MAVYNFGWNRLLFMQPLRVLCNANDRASWLPGNCGWGQGFWKNVVTTKWPRATFQNGGVGIRFSIIVRLIISNEFARKVTLMDDCAKAEKMQLQLISIHAIHYSTADYQLYGNCWLVSFNTAFKISKVYKCTVVIQALWASRDARRAKACIRTFETSYRFGFSYTFLIANTKPDCTELLAYYFICLLIRGNYFNFL